LIGREHSILTQLQEHVQETLDNSVEFSYEAWLKRPLIEKIFERILVPFRHLL
jgi:hypothetical protein